MPILGAHLSTSGGFYRAVDMAEQLQCDCLQLFTKNNNQWRARAIDDEQVRQFVAAQQRFPLQAILAHSSYLINLAAPDAVLWKRSIDALVVELQRADRLSIPYVVVHPGAFTTSSASQGLKRIIRALNEVHRQTRALSSGLLLENTAGQGTTLGWRFEHLARMLDGAQDNDRLGVCLDTCHAFAAGYPLDPQRDYRKTIRELDAIVGLQRVQAIHLNDSKRELGSRVDRHEHIGLGRIGIDAFGRLVRDRRFRSVPMYLETPKGLHPDRNIPWDAVNLDTLRTLARE